VLGGEGIGVGAVGNMTIEGEVGPIKGGGWMNSKTGHKGRVSRLQQAFKEVAQVKAD